jgi:hypothetical protein
MSGAGVACTQHSSVTASPSQQRRSFSSRLMTGNVCTLLQQDIETSVMNTAPSDACRANGNKNRQEEQSTDMLHLFINISFINVA